MLRLAVTTNAQTYERMRDPLASRDIQVDYVQPKERVFDLQNNPFEEYDVGFVYPSRLPEGGVVDACLDVPWVNDRESICRSRHKAATYARLQRAGIEIPRTVMASSPVDRAELTDAFESFEPPVVVKPNSATRGAGVTKVHDRDSFYGVVDYLTLLHEEPTTADKSFLIQEYLPKTTDYRAMVIDGTYAGAVERAHPDGERWKHNVHQGARASATTLTQTQQRLVERVATTLDIPFLGVDLLESEGTTYVIETNARPTIDDPEKYETDFYDELAALIRAHRR